MMLNQEQKTSLETGWGQPLELSVCERCDWRFLLPQGSLPRRCPHCFGTELTRLEGELESHPYLRPPELVVPFALSPSSLAAQVEAFARGIPYAPADLNPASLQARLQRVYLPQWLVDAEVQAEWQAEAGFDYEVVSHQDRYDEGQGGWSSRQVQEGRIRWEPRLGRLTRAYGNIPAPALEEHAVLKAALGAFPLQDAVAYGPQVVAEACLRQPDRTPADAWSEAAPAVQAAAAEECRQAVGADHLREFHWQPEFTHQNWSLLLLPFYTTYYLDDEGREQLVLLHGRSGQISGTRRASMKRAQRTAMMLLGIAAVIFFISLLLSAASLVAPPVLVAGAVGGVIALIIAGGAVVPVAQAWNFNRQGQ